MRNKVFNLRVSESDLIWWRKAANGKNLSHWARDRLHEAAQRELLERLDKKPTK